jgi:hypothetical protein
MSKSRKKKSATKKAAKPAKQNPASASTTKGAGNRQLVVKQPQVKQQAAVANAMFLYTDDAWSLQYFNPDDLHCKEREVFG